MGEQPKMMHLPMRACRSLSQREGGGASGTDVEEEKARRDGGCCARGRARRVRRARGIMARVCGREGRGKNSKQEAMRKGKIT